MSMMIGYAYGQQPNYTAADVDDMVATDASRAWEELNTESDTERRYKEAAGMLKKAIEALDKVSDYVQQASEDAEGIPLGQKLEFYARDFQDRVFDLKRIREKALLCEEV